MPSAHLERTASARRGQETSPIARDGNRVDWPFVHRERATLVVRSNTREHDDRPTACPAPAARCRGHAHPQRAAAAPAGRGDRGTADGSRRRGRGPPRAGRQGRRLPRVADGGGPAVAGVRGEGHRRAHHGRRRHPAGGRDVATGCSSTPVKALQEGGLSEGSKVGSTLLELRRTVEDLDPKEATGAKKFLGMIPFGDKVTDYFRKYQSAQSHLDGILHALRDGQDELGKDNAALNLEKQYLWDAMARLNQYVYVAERLDARLAAAHRRARGHRPRQGQGAARRRALLRAPEAPGPADPAGRVDPELPGDRHRHQEQHRADQGRRPRVDDHGRRRCAPRSSWPRRWATRSWCSTRSPP